jgi:hypothetical protein
MEDDQDEPGLLNFLETDPWWKDKQDEEEHAGSLKNQRA